MTYYCNKNELKELLDYYFNNDAEFSHKDFKIAVDNSLNWQDMLYTFSYLFLQLIERHKKEGGDVHRYLELFYQLENYMWFKIQDFDRDFITFIMRTIRNEALSLEDEIIEAQKLLCERRYDKIIRC